MLDTFIIDAIRREEAEKALEKERENRIWLEIPEIPRQRPVDEVEKEPDGPIIIPLYPDDEEDAA